MEERQVAFPHVRANLSSALESLAATLPGEQREYEAKLRISLLETADIYLLGRAFSRAAELGRVLGLYRRIGYTGNDHFLIQVCTAVRKELEFTRRTISKLLADAEGTKLYTREYPPEQREHVRELCNLLTDSYKHSAPKKKSRQRMTDAAFKNNRRALRNAADFRPKQLTGNPIALFDDFDYLRAHGMGVSLQADEPQSAG